MIPADVNLRERQLVGRDRGQVNGDCRRLRHEHGDRFAVLGGFGCGAVEKRRGVLARVDGGWRGELAGWENQHTRCFAPGIGLLVYDGVQIDRVACVGTSSLLLSC